MGKSTIIEDQERLDYKKRLAEFMQEINPKMDEAIIEKIKEHYRKERFEN